MSHHARVEELSDSDPDEMDIGSVEPAAPAHGGPRSMTFPERSSAPAAKPPAAAPPRGPDMEKAKTWQCLYPLYFDGSRTRAEGRRVGKELAVPNPLAREICDAVFGLGLQLAFEAGKTHPSDWANPGRIRVLVKENGKNVNRNVKNKHDLYTKVARHLKANPANEQTPLRLKIPGMPPMSEPPPPPAIPRGWKMSSILPLHSAAVSGGGVSENLFKDMMAEMTGQGGDTGGAPSKPKKEKKLKG